MLLEHQRLQPTPNPIIPQESSPGLDKLYQLHTLRGDPSRMTTG
ncbi:MAG TPA: hypothetical protein VEC12_10395 [Bacteroidia bacterium]|nr:hypothetical protein [Bacteroidia bacterium]